MSSGDNVFEVLFKLLTSICKMIVDGVRKAEDVAKYIQRVNDDPNFMAVLNRPAQASVNTDVPVDGWAAEWQRFFKEVFGITVDLSSVQIPDDHGGGFGWVVFVVKELTYNRVYAKCREMFTSSSHYGDDLDKVIIKEKEERTAEMGPYAVRFRNRVEPDDENKSISAIMLAERQIQNITLLEAMLLELWYYWRTGGGHLNFVNWGMCPGSRDRYGYVPCVCRYDDGFRVFYCSPSGASGRIRSRSAVRLPLNPSVL